MKIRPLRTELFHAVRLVTGQMDRHGAVNSRFFFNLDSTPLKKEINIPQTLLTLIISASGSYNQKLALQRISATCVG